MSDKSKFHTDIEKLAPDQFDSVAAVVDAERARRTPPNFATMPQGEFEQYLSDHCHKVDNLKRLRDDEADKALQLKRSQNGR